MPLSIVKELFVNVLIVISSLSLGNMLTRDREMVIKKRAGVLLGFLSGMLGCLLIMYSVRVNNDILVDFRYIPIMIMGIYINFRSTLITATLIGLFCLVFLGISNVSIIALALSLFCGIFCGGVGKLKLSVLKKWGVAYVGVALITSAVFIYLLHNQEILNTVLMLYLIGLSLVTTISFLLMSYIMKINKIYYNMANAESMDFLTSVHNVRSFRRGLESIIQNAKKTGECFSLFYIDIDHFKHINDTYGHMSGDKVLRDFACLLVQESRDIDLVYRSGGEEFCIIIQKCRHTNVLHIAERLRANVEQTPFVIEGQNVIHLTVSIGVASYPENATDSEALVKLADRAMYSAKESGRNKVCAAS